MLTVNTKSNWVAGVHTCVGLCADDKMMSWLSQHGALCIPFVHIVNILFHISELFYNMMT